MKSNSPVQKNSAVKVRTQSMSTSNLTGFNPSAVTDTLNKLQNKYNDMIFYYLKYTNAFLDHISIYWACPEATEYFQNIFCPTFNDFINQVDLSVESIFNTINNAARKWALTCNDTYKSISFVRFLHKKIDASSIKNDIGGSVGINAEESLKRISDLLIVKESVSSYLSDMIQVIRNTSFLGNNQQNALLSVTTKIKNSLLDNITENVVTVKDKIIKTSAKYKDVALKNANMFDVHGKGF